MEPAIQPRPDPASEVTLLEMADVAVTSLHIPNVVVLEEVNWTVRRGEYWIVGGLPASGKSDLLATAAGLMQPHRGTVRVFGKEIARLHDDERLDVQLRLGLVFAHGGRLFSHLTVAENLALPLCYHQNCVPTATHERVQAVLDAMNLNAVAGRNPVAITRTLRQRVALARALILSPELLFLDHPLAGLDPRETRWWLEFLDALLENHPLLGGRPLTLVIGTDDLRPWGEHGRQFGYLANRRFVSVGARAELLKQENPALRELIPLDWLRK